VKNVREGRNGLGGMGVKWDGQDESSIGFMRRGLSCISGKEELVSIVLQHD
jgi:hypothetical protein